jgi:hypothetical protein
MIKWRRSPMANVVEKHSVSSELAQKMDRRRPT